MTESGTKNEVEKPESRSSILTLPNQLTIARLILSIVFFVVLALHGYGTLPFSHAVVLNSAMAMFILAVSTDFLDGYLARRWGLVSTFGRIADPFVDKIIICGSFIMLIEVSEFVRPWYAVVILFREFLVSGLRSFIESKGIPFGAMLSGKLKMITQSFAIPTVLFYEANFSDASNSPLEQYAWLETTIEYLALVVLSLTLILTVVSCVGYLNRATKALKAS